MNINLESIFKNLLAGARLDIESAVALYQQAALLDLARAANFARFLHCPEQRVTYLVDRNINYTNVCNTDCSFCGFYRPDSKHPEAYVISREELTQKIEEALQIGATRILLQGGHNDQLSYDYYLDLVSWIHDNFPIELNAFSPSEIKQMHLVSGKSYQEILSELQQAGLAGLPGGGAEILDDDVRKRVSPKKILASEWIEIMEVAHGLSLTTSATMVIGFGETLEQRLNHLTRLRDAQDRSRSKGLRGFGTFISWTLQHNENTSMGRSRHAAGYGAGAIEYLRHVAIGRLFLDNITHHQASWPTLGTDIAQVALHFGCDDIGSTMLEENVVSQAGAPTKHCWSMSPEALRGCIRDAGFAAAQRNSAFDILQVFE
ncbi:MAG: CofH family radical SAM protein [Bdellovibrionales bacterium]|nr:CofH family radical SAM protein [Bdellovibrionales bacterium]